MSTEELRDFYLRYIDLANKREYDRMVEFAHDEVIMNGAPVARDDMVREFHRHTDACRTCTGRCRTCWSRATGSPPA